VAFTPPTYASELGAPQRPQQAVHTVQPPPQDDATVRAIANILLAGAAFATTAKAIEVLLSPFHISAQAAQVALSLANQGTKHRPNARLSHTPGVRTKGEVRTVRDNEVYYRAAYIGNAAKRIQKSLDDGKTIRTALSEESLLYRAHEKARKERLLTVAKVQRAANIYGSLLGWYLDPTKNNEAECIAANGNNFYANQGTVIGLPGSVHMNCGCYAGPPHEGAPLVNDVLHNVVKFGRAKPKFKLRA